MCAIIYSNETHFQPHTSTCLTLGSCKLQDFASLNIKPGTQTWHAGTDQYLQEESNPHESVCTPVAQIQSQTLRTTHFLVELSFETVEAGMEWAVADLISHYNYNYTNSRVQPPLNTGKEVYSGQPWRSKPRLILPVWGPIHLQAISPLV